MHKGDFKEKGVGVHERCEILATTPSRKYLDGRAKPPFPEIVDNTMRGSFRKCPMSFFQEHLLCRVMGADNIHLVAGAAYAAGMEGFRKSYWTKGTEVYRNYEVALDAGVLAIIKAYGYDERREASEDWAKSPKSCERLIEAFFDYWRLYHPRIGLGKPVYINDEVACEMGGLIPLEVLNPNTGEPLMYSIRWDAAEYRDGNLWLLDDKTTTSLGQSWAAQWTLRSQFMGYVYGAEYLYGIKPVGMIARGTGILKTQINHMEVPVTFKPHLLERWWVQVNKDFQAMVDAWNSGDWDYDFADGCAAYGGCKFVDACGSKLQHRVLDSMPIRVWNPANPEDSPVKYIEEL